MRCRFFYLGSFWVRLRRYVFFVGVGLLIFGLSGCLAVFEGDLDREGVLELGLEVEEYDGLSGVGEGRAFRTSREAELALERVRRSFARGRYSEVVEVAEGVIRSLPRSRQAAEAIFWIGESLFRVGEYDRALRVYQYLRRKHTDFVRLREVLERIYEIGLSWIRGRRHRFLWIFSRGAVVEGVEILVDLLKEYPYLRSSAGELIADDGIYTVAQTYFRLGEYGRAREYYERLLRDYPGSEWADLSAFQVALSYLRQSEGVAYDSEPLERAKRKFREYIKRFRRGNRVVEARRILRKIEEDQAGYMYGVALDYQSQGYFVSAVVYYLAVIRRYPGTDWARKAKRVLKEGWAKEALLEWERRVN